MKLFVSWSGTHSHNVALALKEWLPNIFTGIDVFVSSEDIRKGKRWRQEVSKELEATNFGIVCLTPDNMDAPWLLFESGALSKSVKEASVYTLLLGELRPADIQGPLTDFQHTAFEEEDFFKLVKAINEVQGPNTRETIRLRTIFDKFWDDLVTEVSKAVKTVAKPEKKRSPDDMLHDVLEIVTQIAKKMPDRTEHFIENAMFRLELSDTLKNIDKRRAQLEAMWPDILQKADEELPKLSFYLSDSHPIIKGNTLFIELNDAFDSVPPEVMYPTNKNALTSILARFGITGQHGIQHLAFVPKSTPL